MNAFVYLSAILLWGINIWALIIVYRWFRKIESYLDKNLELVGILSTKIEDHFTELRFDIYNWFAELNQDAGDIKRRQTWSKKRENKDLKAEKKLRRK